MNNYQYEKISEQEAQSMTKEHLVFMYNDAVEMIWHLNHRVEDLMTENENVWKAYDDISNEYLG